MTPLKNWNQSGQTIKRLTIASDSSNPSLTMDGNKTELKRGGSVAILSPYTQIQQIIKSKRRPVLFALLNPVSALSMFMIVMVVVGRFASRWPTWSALLIAPPLALVIIMMFKNLAGGFSRILLINHHEAQSFFKRNKDAVIVGTIMTILSSALTFLVAYLLFQGGIK